MRISEKYQPALMDKIFVQVINFFNQKEEDVKQKTRKRKISFTRQLFFYISKQKTKFSHANIGNYLGKDHSTVTHSLRTVNNLIDSDKKIRETVNLLSQRIVL